MNKLAAIAISILPARVKPFLYRMAGLQVGRGVRIGFGSILLCSDADIADGATIGYFNLIRVNTLKVGRRAAILNLNRIAVHTLTMRSQSIIDSQNEISGDPDDERSRLYLGPASWILPHCFINVARPVSLGRNVGIGGGSYLFTHGMWLSKLDGFPVAFGEITIAEDVWLPWGCFILPNVSIGRRVVLGARSVVNRSLPDDVLAAGIPARVVRDRSHVDVSRAQKLEILADVTAGFAARRKAVVRIERTPTAETHWVGDRVLAIVHLQPDAEMHPDTLNIVFDRLEPHSAGQTAAWSLNDYASSPYASLSSDVCDWFRHAREVGIRFYPIDEDAD